MVTSREGVAALVSWQVTYPQDMGAGAGAPRAAASPQGWNLRRRPGADEAITTPPERGVAGWPRNKSSPSVFCAACGVGKRNKKQN